MDVSSGMMRVGGSVSDRTLQLEARAAFREIAARAARASAPPVEYGFHRVGVTWVALPAGGPVPADAVVVLDEIERRARKMDATSVGGGVR